MQSKKICVCVSRHNCTLNVYSSGVPIAALDITGSHIRCVVYCSDKCLWWYNVALKINFGVVVLKLMNILSLANSAYVKSVS